MANAGSEILQEFVQEETPPLGSKPPPTASAAPAGGDTASPEWEGQKTILLDDEDATAVLTLQDTATGASVDVDEFPCVIGRHSNAAYAVTDDSVSRRHAVIDRNDDGAFVVTDCGSLNGIKVNDQKTDQVFLADGDELTLGKLTLRIGLYGVEAPPPPQGERIWQGISLPDWLRRAWPPRLGRTAPAAAVNDADGDDADGDDDGTDQTAALPTVHLARKTTRLVDVIRGQGEPSTVQKGILIGGGVVATALLALLLAYAFSDGRRAQPIPTAAAPVQKAPAAKSDAAGAAGTTNKESAAPDKVGAAPRAVGNMALSREMKSRTPAADDQLPVAPEATAQDVPVADAPTGTGSDDGKTLTAKTADDGKSSTAKAADDGKTATGKTAGETQPAAAKAKPKPKPIRRSAAWSQRYIDRSLNHYLAGEADTAIQRLDVLAGSGRHQRSFRNSAADLAQQLRNARGLYRQGYEAVGSGDKDGGFSAWVAFLETESALFGTSRSVYADNVTREVVSESTAEGDFASAEGRWHDAYRAWQRAEALSPGGAAGASLAELEQRAQDVYRRGYRAENVSLEEARRHWQEVTLLLPPGTKYYTKATAKLSLYSR